METPGPFTVSQEDIDAELRRGTGVQDGKLRIFALYQQEITATDAVAALKKEYGTGGHSHTFLDGTSGFVDYRPNTGLEFWKRPTDQKVIVRWSAVEKRIRQMIAESSYLSLAEFEQYRRMSQQPQMDTSPPSAPAPEPLASAPASTQEITQADIDAALQEWNGDMDSKRRVQRYMTDHGREKGTADWLRSEYGDDLPAFPVTADGAAADLPWSKVQRHLARLVKEDRFFTEQEKDNLEDIDAAYVREQLEQQGDKPSPFVEQVMAEVERIAAAEEARTVREIFEQYKPIVTNLVLSDEAYRNACRNSDRETAIMEGDAAVKRAALTITEPEFMRLYYDMPDFRYRLHREIVDETYPVLSQLQLEQENGAQPPDLGQQPITREGDTIIIGSGDAATHEVTITVSDEEWQEIQEALPDAAAQPPRDPMAPAYSVGDKVFLDNTEYTVTDINLFDVQLLDPIVSTHSLTILKELLKEQERDGRNFSVIYLKNPSAPMVTQHHSYELLKADLLGQTTFDRPKPKIYFEDEVGQHIFQMLISSLNQQYETLINGNELRGQGTPMDATLLKSKIESFEGLRNVESNLIRMVMNLGCEELLKIATRDAAYFGRVIFLLDGDARYKDPTQKPKVREYLLSQYKACGFSDRQHTPNICFLPNYFAPESYLYRIICELMHYENNHAVFWRTLDQKEETALYTATKIRDIFSHLPNDFNNDDLKKIFGDYHADPIKNSELWKFIDKSGLIDYYYGDYGTIDELLSFFTDFKSAYEMTKSKTLANRFG